MLFKIMHQRETVSPIKTQNTSPFLTYLCVLVLQLRLVLLCLRELLLNVLNGAVLLLHLVVGRQKVKLQLLRPAPLSLHGGELLLEEVDLL